METLGTFLQRLLSLLCLVLASCSAESTPAKVLAGNDVKRLNALGVSLPAGVLDAHWLMRTKGEPGRAPGPTDTELLVWIPLSAEAWARLAPAFTTRPGAAYPARLHPDFLTATRPLDVGSEVVGQALDPTPLDEGLWHAAWVVWTGHHLVINFHRR